MFRLDLFHLLLLLLLLLQLHLLPIKNLLLLPRPLDCPRGGEK